MTVRFRMVISVSDFRIPKFLPRARGRELIIRVVRIHGASKQPNSHPTLIHDICFPDNNDVDQNDDVF